MTAKQVRWILQQHDDDTFDVLRAGRRLHHHLPRDVAMKHIRESKNPQDVVFHEEPDGYRTRLSGRRSGRKKG